MELMEMILSDENLGRSDQEGLEKSRRGGVDG